ncbi:MAG: VWA domain-containing protein, partial [Pyrinomonadaceae bacterium]
TPPDDIDDADIVRVSSTLVVVPVSVIDAAGQPVLGLTVPDFRMEEQGKAQEITQIGNPEQVPLDIALLIDVSSSTSKKFDFELQAATRFLKQVLKPGDRAAVFAVEMEPRLVQPLASADVASAQLLGLRAPETPVPTAFYDGVRNAAKYLTDNTPSNHHRVIVVISDGDDNFSLEIRDVAIADFQNRTDPPTTPPQDPKKARIDASEKRQKLLHDRAQADVLREVQRADISVYSINPSGTSVWLNQSGLRAQKGMELISEGTGGTSFLPNKVEDLDQVFRQITAELRAQYLLQYYSSDESSADGKFLTIKVQVPQKATLRVRARSGYYVKRK